MINLNTKIAKFKFKKLGEINYSLWIMLIKPIQRVKLTFVCMLFVFYCFFYINKFNNFTNVAWLSIRSYFKLFDLFQKISKLVCTIRLYIFRLLIILLISKI